MKLRAGKEIEVGEGMEEILRGAGFERTMESDDQDTWRDALGRQITVTNVGAHSFHDPIEAEVHDARFRPNVVFAYNPKGLAVLLGREVQGA